MGPAFFRSNSGLMPRALQDRRYAWGAGYRI
jgi:hypothetical protein